MTEEHVGDVETAQSSASRESVNPHVRLRSLDEMHLKVGTILHVAATGFGTWRAKTTLIGWLKSRSIVVTPFHDGGEVISLIEGEQALVRVFTGRCAFAFNVKILKSQKLPFPYVHLSYPDEIESVVVRSSPRCRADLPATISCGQTACKGSILNLSMTGALIEVAERLEGGADGLRIACSFELHDVPVSLMLSATILGDKTGSVSGDEEGRRYAVTFRDLEPNHKLMLGAFIWYRMYEYPQEAI
jgi:c-di-GMP-binding flagellar brake protein YcgR